MPITLNTNVHTGQREVSDTASPETSPTSPIENAPAPTQEQPRLLSPEVSPEEFLSAEPGRPAPLVNGSNANAGEVTPLGPHSFSGSVSSTTSGSGAGARRVDVVQYPAQVLNAQGNSGELKLHLAPDVQSFHISIRGKDGHFYVVNSLVDPDGKELVSPSHTGATPNERSNDFGGPRNSLTRSQSVNQGVGGFMLPNEDDHDVKTGAWTFQIAGRQADLTTSAGGEVDVKVHLVRERPDRKFGKLALKVHLPGIHGWTAANADKSPFLVEALETATKLLAKAGIEVDDLSFADIDSRFSVVDSSADETPEKLFALGKTEGALNVFLASRVYVDDMQAGGLSGGIPGPVDAGTSGSGVVAGVLSPRAQSAEMTGVVIAHEALHFLGLSHTTESDGETHDQIADTAEGAGGRQNLMYFQDRVQGTRTVSEEQGKIVRGHPLVRGF